MGWPNPGEAMGAPPPSPLQDAQPTPSHCPPDAKCQFSGICNRQQPPPTASATSSNRLSNRLWGRFGGPFPSNASVPPPHPPGSITERSPARRALYVEWSGPPPRPHCPAGPDAVRWSGLLDPASAAALPPGDTASASGPASVAFGGTGAQSPVSPGQFRNSWEALRPQSGNPASVLALQEQVVKVCVLRVHLHNAGPHGGLSRGRTVRQGFFRIIKIQGGGGGLPPKPPPPLPRPK